MSKRKKSNVRFQPDVLALIVEVREMLGLSDGVAVNHLVRLAACAVLERRAEFQRLTARTLEYRIKAKADKAAEAARAHVMAEAAKAPRKRSMFGKDETWREVLKKVEPNPQQDAT